ncbi:type II secretion system F family protein [Novosphingobium sp. M1R2S20]|uniref:Type II secretion system F family protein n=1 Tax=Novosphingobium rhizovicinum TaxID=3228928 RepID=A0ABV3R7S9_9SPHN
MNLIQILIIAAGLTAAVGAVWVAFAGPSPAKESARRLNQVRYRHSESAVAKVEAQMRKAVAARRPKVHQIAGSTSRIEALELRLHRTGKNWTLKNYLLASFGIFATVAAFVLLKSGAPMLALLIGVVAGAGIPHIAVNILIKRRTNEFIVKFADAIDLLVRGLRSGLPVTETLAVVANEIPGPVGQEFKLITERIKIGKTMEDALQDTADRLNLPEFSFFCITLAIQRETGGNLAETLANLSDVLRKRAQMKLKIRAMSSESKASAYIVGSLPFIVFGLIYWVNSGYIGKFFEDERLIVAGLGGMVWMSIGAFIMAKMVSFEI